MAPAQRSMNQMRRRVTRRWLAFASCVVVALTNDIGGAVLSLSLQDAGTELHASSARMQVVMTLSKLLFGAFMLLGGVLGVLLAKYFFIPALVAAGNKTSISIWLVNFKVSPQTLAMAFIVSVGVGILAGFVPAIRSSQLRIVDGLRKVV